jgi:hypothetical protein
MSRKYEKKSEMWDILKQNEVTSPVPPSSKSTFLPNINKQSRESVIQEDPSRFIQKFEENPSNDIRLRLRELEIQMVDLRAGIERRLSTVTEEFPNRLNKELRIIQERDTYLWKENTQKQTQLFEALKILQDSFRSGVKQANNDIALLGRKIDEIAVKQSYSLQELNQIVKYSKPAAETQPQQDLSPIIQSFKDMIQEEKRRREYVQQEHSAHIQELHMLIRNYNTEHNKRLQEYRDQIIISENDAKGHIFSLEANKEEKNRSDQEYLRNVYGNLQKRLEEEVVQRTQLEKEYKAWTDNRLNGFQKMMKNEEKGLVDREANILKMMQEGLGALHEIITRVKESGSLQLNKAQTMMNENLKDLAEALSAIKDSIYKKIEGIEFSLEEEGKYRLEQSNMTYNHIQNIVDSIERQGTHLENQIMSSENRLRSTIFEMQQDSSVKDQKLTEWQLSHKEYIEDQLLAVKKTLEKQSKDWETKYKDSKDQIEQTDTKIIKIKDDLNTSLDQINNKINFEDGIIEKKVENAINTLNDKFDREILYVKNLFEKTLSGHQTDQNNNFVGRMEQFQRLLEDLVKAKVSEETLNRQAEDKNLEKLIKGYSEKLYERVNSDLNVQIYEISEKLSRTSDEESALKGQITKIRNETESSIEELFSSIDEVANKLKSWTEQHTGQKVSIAKDEIKMLIDIEREILLKELDKTKSELKASLDQTDTQCNKSNIELMELNKATSNEVAKERQLRSNEIKGIEKRLEDIMGLMQEAISQSSEAVKALCRALVTKEAVERNQSQESIMKSVQARMNSMEDLLKFYSAKATEDLRMELKTLIEIEKNSRNQAELQQSHLNTQLKSLIKSNKDFCDVQLCLQGIIDEVIQINTSDTIVKQKIQLEGMNKALADNFDKNLKGINENVSNLNRKIEDEIKEVKNNEIVRNCVDNLINFIEKQDANDVIKETHSNIESLFRNMQALEGFINSTKEDLEKYTNSEAERIKDEIIKDLDRIEIKGSENQELNKEKIDFLMERFEEIEKSSYKKAINDLEHSMETIKKDVYDDKETMSEITVKHEELKNQLEQFIRTKTTEENEIQSSLKILADRSTKIEENLNEFQQEFPSILQQIGEHDTKIKDLLRNTKE